MKNKDFIKLLLTTYGYTFNIKIESYKMFDGVAYEVSAENPENGDTIYIDSDNFQSTIYDILDYFNRYDIKPTIKFVDIPIKTLLNDKERQECHQTIIQRDAEIKTYIQKTQFISEMLHRYHPCIACRFNKKDHWDNVHFRCEKNHNMSCSYLKVFNDITSELFSRSGKLSTSDMTDYEERLKDNHNNTSKKQLI